MSINNVCISGNLTHDAKKKETKGGNAVVTFSVAVNERRKNANDEWEDYANYIDCALFGKLGEALAQYLTKGTKVAVSGHLRWSQWERDGQKRSKLDVIADEIELIGGKKAASADDEPVPFD